MLKTLGTYSSWKTHGMQRQLVNVKDEFVYIPILEVLERMLQNQTIFEEVTMLVIMVSIIIAVLLDIR